MGTVISGRSRVGSGRRDSITLGALVLATLSSFSASLYSQGLDLDGNGLGDLWTAYYGAENLLPQNDDDGDGATNREEDIAGTNPLDPSSVHRSTFRFSGSRWSISWNADPMKTYRLQMSHDMRVWTNVGSPVENSTGQTSLDLDSTRGAFVRISVSDRDMDLDGLTAWEESGLGFSDSDASSHGGTRGNDFPAAYARAATGNSYTFRGRSFTGARPTLAESSRFLQQATMGSGYAAIESVSNMGIAPWIEAQFALPATSHVVTNNTLRQSFTEEGEDFELSPYSWTWWDTATTSPDVLRQRVAFALSEIFVISQTTEELLEHYWGVAVYYDILVNNAFGNYRDLLYKISTNPAMGHFLSHVKNRPTDLANNIFPDENYAREVMQLFSIGLFELNQDGSRVRDSNGNDIPTYDNSDITNFAKVFTGLTYNPRNPGNGTPFDEEEFNPIENATDYLEASSLWMGMEMAQYEPMHETGEKLLLKGAKTNGAIQQDLDAAIDNLFNHPNVGPFIGRLLIQRLVTSNPSPGYIYRVADTFNNNGAGVRGDMKAVIRAILLDPEARNRSNLRNPRFGKLREPVMRHTHLLRAFSPSSSTGRIPAAQFEAVEAYGQNPMNAPSVFNFYLPDHQPLGPLKNAGLVGPEFQITTATTTIKAMNFWAGAFSFEELVTMDEDFFEDTVISYDYNTELALADSADTLPALVDRLDIILTRGDLSPGNRTTILNTLTQAFENEMGSQDLLNFALYLFANCPDFAVLK